MDGIRDRRRKRDSTGEKAVRSSARSAAAGDPDEIHGDDLESMLREVTELRERVAELEQDALAASPDPAGRLLSGLLQLPIAFYRIGEDGRFREIVGRALERIGTDSKDMVGRDVLDFFPEAEEAVVRSLDGHTMWSETSGRFEGRPWAALSFVTPVEEGGGTIGVSLDVTDWKLARDELAASERRFRSLAETVPVAISRSDLAGTIVYANERMGDLLGRSPGGLLGTSWIEFLHERDRDRVRQDWIESKRTLDGHEGTFRVRRDDGRVLWVMSRSVIELGPDGSPAGFVSSLVDVSERKQVEEELNRRVAERTAQLVHANQELEAFCYSVSHDLRSPLRSIDGFCRLVEEEFGAELPSGATAYLERVRAASLRMGVLIDDLLALSRASLGDLKRTRVDLSEMARGIAGELRHSAPDRRVRFEIADGIEVQGDAALLQDAFENLLGNAFKFTARRDDATVELFATTTPEGERAIVVRDNGAGFDMAESSRLFTAFHRLHSETEFEGTGIGLATVERIVRRHGGRIWAEAAPDKGATFHLTLPEA